MKKTPLFASLLCLLLSTLTLAADGDMGGPTQDGSETNPYLIEDVNDFDTFADPANAATYWAAGVHTKLTTNINLTGRTYTTAPIAPDTDNGTGGYQDTPFAGVFDGNGNTISNLTINTPDPGDDYLGLFGETMGVSAEVKNLGFINAS